MLASIWACEKFDRYIAGLDQFCLLTDHKPLVPLINTQDLNNTPLRCQRLLMRLRKYNPIAEYVPGKLLLVSDALSRSPTEKAESTTEKDVEMYIDTIIKTRSATDRKLKEIRNATSKDSKL